jgi:hypothetical protein
MKRTRRSLVPGPAMIVALLALAVALSGAGYAATTIGTGQITDGAVTTPKLHGGAVTAAKLADGAVSGRKIAGNAVTSAKVKDGTLLAKDFKPGVLSGGAVQGTPGPQGPAGPQGPKGESGVQGFYSVWEMQAVEPGQNGVAEPQCAVGDAVSGGGFSTLITVGAQLDVTGSHHSGIGSPEGVHESWLVSVLNTGPTKATFGAVAVCADRTP